MSSRFTFRTVRKEKIVQIRCLCLNPPLMENTQAGSRSRLDWEIFIVSVLILYLELVLIRWIGTEIRIFAYLGNLILVICFFGTGLGCSLSAKPVSLAKMCLNIFLLAFLVANPFHLDRKSVV